MDWTTIATLAIGFVIAALFVWGAVHAFLHPEPETSDEDEDRWWQAIK